LSAPLPLHGALPIPAGPAACTPAPEPTNSPAPIAEPRLIITRWRGFIPALRPVDEPERSDAPDAEADTASAGCCECDSGTCRVYPSSVEHVDAGRSLRSGRDPRPCLICRFALPACCRVGPRMRQAAGCGISTRA